MRRSSPFAVFLLIAIALATLWGFATVLDQRFRAGEVYPEYSTLRSDPLGSKALYNSLSRLNNIECRRNFRWLEKLEGGKGQTLVLLNLSASDFMDSSGVSGDSLLKWAAAGGRVVLTGHVRGNSFSEAMAEGRDAAKQRRIEKLKKERESKSKKKSEKDAKDEKNDPKKESDDEERGKELKSISEVLGLKIEGKAFVIAPKGGNHLTWDGSMPLDEADQPRWYSDAYFGFVKFNEEKKVFEDVKNEGQWQVLASKKDQPMLMERRFGRGSIVVASDSYFASNEALYQEPKPAFIAWLMGNASTIIFDETHHGVHEQPGIMTLARRYRLHGLFIGALILFGLFIWRNSMSLIPATSGHGPISRAVAGQGATAGMVSLLKRGVPRATLLQKCLDVWEKHSPPRSPAAIARVDAAKQIMASEAGKSRWKQQLAEAYRRMSEAIHLKS